MYSFLSMLHYFSLHMFIVIAYCFWYTGLLMGISVGLQHHLSATLPCMPLLNYCREKKNFSIVGQ